jgi:hypothetical protein
MIICEPSLAVGVLVLLRKVLVKYAVDLADKSKTADIHWWIGEHVLHQFFFGQNMSSTKLLGIAPFTLLGKFLIQSVFNFQYRGFMALYKIGVVAVEISQAIAKSPGCALGNVSFEGGRGDGHLLGQVFEFPQTSCRQGRRKGEIEGVGVVRHRNLMSGFMSGIISYKIKK